MRSAEGLLSLARLRLAATGRRRKRLRASAPVLFTTLLAASPAFAADGAYATDWGSSGRSLLQLSTLDDVGSTIAVQRDGKLLLAGYCGMSSGRHTLCAARLRTDGQFDLGFGPNETGRILLNSVPDLANFDTTLGLHGFALQADGRAILGGNWTCGNWSGCKAGLLVRLTTSGVAEPNPNSQYGVSYAYNASYTFNTVEAVAVAPDGKLVAAGCTVRADSDPPNYDFGVARFNADLTPDTSFGSSGSRVGAFDLGGDQYDCAAAAIVLPDRKIVAAGAVRGTDGRLKAGLMKLNVDGSMDAAFGNNGRTWFDRVQWSPGDIAIRAITLDRRGRLVVAGRRQIWDGNDQDFFVARLDATTGALDATFSGGVSSIPIDLAAPFTDIANDLVVQGDGRILVAGQASTGNASTAFAVVRFNDDGSTSTSFGSNGIASGSFSPPSQTANQQDAGFSMAIGNGGLFLAGSGREQNGGARFGIAKLQVDAIFADGFER